MYIFRSYSTRTNSKQFMCAEFFVLQKKSTILLDGSHLSNDGIYCSIINIGQKKSTKPWSAVEIMKTTLN